jgi:hypothetical protein
LERYFPLAILHHIYLYKRKTFVDDMSQTDVAGAQRVVRIAEDLTFIYSRAPEHVEDSECLGQSLGTWGLEPSKDYLLMMGHCGAETCDAQNCGEVQDGTCRAADIPAESRGMFPILEVRKDNGYGLPPCTTSGLDNIYNFMRANREVLGIKGD